jgi:hypothetical protein
LTTLGVISKMSWVPINDFFQQVDDRRMESIELRRPSATIWSAMDWECMVIGEAKRTDRQMGLQE